MLKLFVAVLSAVLGAGALSPPVQAAEPRDSAWTVAQPTAHRAGGLSAAVTLDGASGALSLTVRRGTTTVLEPAPVGIVTDSADFSSGLRNVGSTVRAVTERYSTTTGKRRERTARMNETRLAFADREGHRMDLVVRVADDGIAYRYVLPDAGQGTVRREASAFQLPSDAPAWLLPYTVNYERPRTRTTAAGAATGDFGSPSLFQVNDSYVLLTESDVDGRYAGSRLAHQTGTGRYEVRLADEEIAFDGPLETPWRTAVVGGLDTVTESTLVDDLAPPSKIGDTSWIRPGKVAWSWLAGFSEAQRSLETQKRFVDYSAAHGWEYSLVDDGWKTTDWMPKLIEHANRRGVKILLWMHWTDLDTPEERETNLSRIQEWGAAGLKIDFMDSESRDRYRWYDEILADTAKRHLLVNFHGSTIPHGIQRTWPHVMGMEAVYGAEQGNVSIGDVTTLPFTRNVVGSMDYTPMGFQFGQRNTSEAAELALSVVYESGFQNYAGSVDAYRRRPELERFLDQVPTVWDETRLLAGSPGEGATFARRSAKRWFLGGVTAGDPRTQQVPLDFLGRGRWRVDVVRDGSDGLVRESRIVDRGDTLDVPTVRNGGFAALVCPARPGSQTCDKPVDRLPLTTFSATPERTQAEAGGSVDLSGRFLVDQFGPVRDVTVAATAPSGWTLEGEDAHAAELPTGRPLAADWKVRVPADAAPGYHDVVVAVTYRAPAEGSDAPALRTERTVRIFVKPPGVDYVSDLPFVQQSNGWGPVERDRSNGETGGTDGGPLRIRGKEYDKGLGTHAASEVTVDTGGAYTRFTASVGIDDEASGTGSVAFEVLGDGEVLARTGVLTREDAAVLIDVDITGVQKLTLRVTDGGDGANYDHADWGDTRLQRAG
ncbi:glycoside hydrolase family 97 catalytic domain-containing protein [Streptomyces sp. NBC_00878]|nr:glycoside hydrolase family 97 catalytic domain-containing protein [Streptomyces sp. NBC_00878]